MNNLAYHNSDEYENEICDSSKQVEASKEPITDTHIVDRVCNLLVGTSDGPSDVPANVIAELKDDEHKEPLVIEKGTSYFNIFECGRNLLDKLDVTYQ